MNVSRSCIALIGVVSLVLALGVPRATAAPGDLDPSFGGFGSSGKITNPPSSFAP